jgi:predicted phosphodiesterase
LNICSVYFDGIKPSGHTHRVQNKKVGKTLVLNPGTANG